MVVGPTGTGKSSLSLALAHALNGEVLNVDAMQMYSGLPVITNQLPVEERQGIPHHLLDVIPPLARPWTVRQFVRAADRVIETVSASDKPVVAVGGTGYYAKALLFRDGLLRDDGRESASEEETDETDEANGETLQESEQKWPILSAPTDQIYAELMRLDPEMAMSWHHNDRRHIQRSLEICLQSGQRASDLYTAQAAREDKVLRSEGECGDQVDSGGILRHDPLIFYLHADDAVLKDRLNARVHDMVSAGLFEEALSLHKLVLQDPDSGALLTDSKGVQISIGYKELLPWTSEQTCPPTPLSVEDAKRLKIAQECVKAVQAATRRYARRQERYVRHSLSRSLRKAGIADRLFVLDATNLDTFYTDVVPRASRIAKAFLNGDSLPEPADLVSPNSEASELIEAVSQTSDAKSTTNRVKRYCEVCDKSLMTDDEWNRHGTSRGHRRAVQGRKKHEQMVAYLASRTDKEQETRSFSNAGIIDTPG